MKRLAAAVLVLLVSGTVAWSSSAAAGDLRDSTSQRELVGPIVRVQPSEVAHLDGRLKRRAHRVVVLQRLSRDGWVDVRTTKTSGRGGFAFRVTASSHVGSTKYRVVQGRHRTETTQVQVVVPGSWRSISSGGSYVCGVKSDRSGWCWGRGDFGQLGIGGTPSRVLVPRRLPGEWQSITATMRGSTCGIRVDGSGWCWGTYPGNGTGTSDVPVPLDGTWRALLPVAYSEFAGGPVATHCGIRTDDTAWCWGDNLAGELGTGEPWPGRAVLTPHQLPGLWRDISYALHTRCGIRTDGTGWCWGFNYAGQVGDGTTVDRISPVQLPGTWSSLAPSDQGTTCGTRTDGSGWCWGTNAQGQVGDGTRSDRPTPYQLPGQWQSIDAGSSTVCGIQGDRSGWCWGDNGSGGVGDGTKHDRLTPFRLPGAWSSLTASYATCGVRVHRTGWCWGGNFAGGVGDGTKRDRLTPFKITGRWVSIEPGFRSCGIHEDATASCWGSNLDGGVGNGTTEDRLTPTRLDGRWRVLNTDITPCGIRTDGTGWCWGHNSRGQTGSGIQGKVLSPVVLP